MFILKNWHSRIKYGVAAVLVLITLTHCYQKTSVTPPSSTSVSTQAAPAKISQPLEVPMLEQPITSSSPNTNSEIGTNNENPTSEATSGTASQQPGKIVVDISTQKLYLYLKENSVINEYDISTSKYGIGSQAGSNKTPLGRHHIEQKIGEGAPLNTIFKARVSTNRQAEIDQEQGDVVTTRILWLKGLEKGKNAGSGIDSYQRFIYIHGTAAEKDIGKPASHGCIRMYNQEVIDLFQQVPEKLLVEIVCTVKDGAGNCDYAPEVKEKMEMSSH